MKNFGGVYKQLRWLKVIVDLFHLSILSWESKSHLAPPAGITHTPWIWKRLSSEKIWNTHHLLIGSRQTGRLPAKNYKCWLLFALKYSNRQNTQKKMSCLMFLLLIDISYVYIYISSVSFHFPHPHCLSPASRHQIHWHLHPQLAPKFR